MFSTIPYVLSRGEPAHTEEGVYLYGLSFCDHCRKGKELLDELGVSYRMTYLDELDPDVRRPVLKQFREIYQKSVVYPVLEVDGSFTFGYSREVWSDLLLRVSQKS